ncbi:ArsR/SmtB family transcription factor [Candidatus Halobonum tyrrellensis]|uniref:ArsR family transcriptional regulator n=1 Tax=Candidatus Halobonum tyrrellensis G22 TaxID=1324957 RepID=V4GRD4_9EURY|nr:winged helix-turn-helix domain-containing protein [Candidatus Halobonum tyrrellensis]ESP87616.1 ArsR family transcriptional regulator [Candidatus Halobonum tyrrellensis G22]
MSEIIDRVQSRPEVESGEARVVCLADGDADAMLDALGTETRRDIVRRLFEEPATTSELAADLDSSVQNVHQHLGRLEEAGLVSSVGTVYSEKGAEMRLFAPANDPLVLVGDADRERRVRADLTTLLAGGALLAGATVLVQVGVERLAAPADPTAPGVAPLSYPGGGSDPLALLEWVVFGLLEPGIVFLLACLVLAAALLVVDR